MDGSPELLLEMRDVGVERDGRWLVRDVSLSVSRGEIVTIIGPNGAGKSTTVRAALGVIRPDRGTVRRRPHLTVGYVPQRLAVDRSMPLTLLRWMSLTVTLKPAAAEAAMAEVGIRHLASAQIQQLSGGEFQRALLARAIARRPDLLVLDEPVQNVDFAGEVALYELIAAIRDRTGCGVLLISHDLHVVMAATDTVICLNGHVCCSGTPETVSADPAYQHLFGRRGAEALAIYRHRHDHTHLPDGRIRLGDGTILEGQSAHGAGAERGQEGGGHA